jgi:hypothetical protein
MAELFEASMKRNLRPAIPTGKSFIGSFNRCLTGQVVRHTFLTQLALSTNVGAEWSCEIFLEKYR